MPPEQSLEAQIAAARARFDFHTPEGTQQPGIDALRKQHQDMAHGIVANTKPSREQSLALTALEESCMWAIKAVFND